MKTIHRCWAEIETTALRHNADVARAHLAPGGALLAVVKANAYGHGLAAVAKALETKADLFGVANLDEAIETRDALPQPVLILGPALPSERAEIIERRFIPTISSAEEAREFSRLTNGETVAVNCAIDTGMGRIGMTEEAAIDELKTIASLSGVEIHSISTHLPAAEEDEGYTTDQLSRFQALVRQIRLAVPGKYKVHALPSAGLLAFADANFEIARAGLMLYGVSPAPRFQDELRPAMAFKSRVVLVRDVAVGTSVSYGRTWIAPRKTRIATLSVGYADGFPRFLSGRGAAVLIRGRRCPVLGRVTMDLTMADVTDLDSLAVGDEAVLIGRQGAEDISAREVAERAGTIAWEIFTGIGSRVARVYV